MKDIPLIPRLLAAAALRRTPVRAHILELLAHAPRPLGAVDILAKLPPHTDAVTVYRTLNTFTRKKIVHRIRGEDRVWRYALGDDRAIPQHQHPHFVCETCGKVECLRDSEIPRSFLASLAIAPRYEVRYSEVLLHGLCPRCRP